MTAESRTERVADPLADGWRRPRGPRTAYRVDAWVALALAGGTALSISLTLGTGLMGDAPWWQVVIWVALIALPLAARRRWPEAVALLVSLVFAVFGSMGVTDGLFSSICLYVAIYSVGAWSHHRTIARWTRLGIIAGMFIWLFWSLLETANQSTAIPELSRDGFFSPYAAYGLLQVLLNLVYFWAAYYFGGAAWQAARRSAALEALTRELATERERTAAQAVSLERVRIARELHDVIAHHVSLMGVQAGAARRILDRDPANAARAITVIEESARSAVDELNTMLGALRADDTDGAQPAHQSTSTRGVDQLAELAQENTDAGLAVRLQVIGEPRPVPGTIGLSLYRIAQEALTNTRKHAGTGATAELRLRYEADAVELEATDTGRGVRPPAGTAAEQRAPGGLGQQGMRERVAAVGGTLELANRPRGGYLVRARVPLAAPPVAATESPSLPLPAEALAPASVQDTE
ncbi:sensor histidine kinase [Cryobacterium adonitolivorans]|uniref:histidine kinase n=1 Tax=Cryobacterium adonitolivorans TaxID=1259189 RepID=A0A4R8VYM6_9MICO|nr:sensor histidine kinase [Cryobacterium adonitolivorans]TFB98664.1 sensor histidine kinase [Cryobacterium adonitolivorans]